MTQTLLPPRCENCGARIDGRHTCGQPNLIMPKRQNGESMDYRQGDVGIVRVANIPETTEPIARDNGRVVLAYGEVSA